jgi:hypothetical protein
MSRPVVLALRFVVIVAIVGLFTVQIGALSPRLSPYVSSLSPLVASEATAAPKTCNDRNCDLLYPASCFHQKGYRCQIKGPYCTTGVCL